MTDKNLFREKWYLEPVTGCWIWKKSNKDGEYGIISWLGETRAHRVSYLLYRGKIPDGMCVLHKCDRPSCVNPKHLFLGTQRDNVKDMIRKGRNFNTKTPEGDPSVVLCHGYKCKNNSEPGRKLCEFHAEKHRQYNRKWKAKFTSKRREGNWRRVWRKYA